MKSELSDVVVQGLTALHAWQVNGEWVIAAMALGVVVGAYVLPAASRALLWLREFSAYCAWREAERERQAEELQKQAESEHTLRALARRGATVASGVRPAVPARILPPEPARGDQTEELTCITALILEDPDFESPRAEDDARTRAYQRVRESGVPSSPDAISPKRAAPARVGRR